MRKKNSQRQDKPWVEYIKQSTRHYIETVFSAIPSLFPKSIHAVTYEGFLLKVQAFILAALRVLQELHQACESHRQSANAHPRLY
jgi:hypothetical protein